MSLIQPLPLLSSARTGRTWDCGATPTTPAPLAAAAAIVPATWVPWPLPSCGEVVLGDEVPALVVVDQAVAVVVEAVGLAPAALLAGVAGELALKVLVGEVDAGVDDRDGHACADAALPRLGRVDVGVGGVVEAPERVPERVVGGRRGRHPAGRGRRRRRRRRRAARRAPRRRRRPRGSTSSVRSIGSVLTSRTSASLRTSRALAPGSRWTMMSPSPARAVAGTASSTADGDSPRINASRVPSAAPASDLSVRSLTVTGIEIYSWVTSSHEHE